ncbi:MAG: type IV pilus modification protein PilV [Pseudomonadota bacterium]
MTKMKKLSGFTLLEVMVAMVVLSIGLLGLAGLMASSMRNNQGAYHRTQATWLAYDALDRVRANRAGALANAYAGANALGSPVACAPLTAPAGANVAAQDINGWKNALNCALPAGDGSIVVDAASRQVTVTVQWDDTRGTGGAAAQQFIVQSRL